MPESGAAFERKDLKEVLGKDGLQHLGQLSEFSVGFERVIGILIAHMEAKDAKITEQHALFEARFQTIEDNLETLTHNINGFSDDFEEQIEEQKRAQQEELEQLSKQFVSRDTFMQSKAAPEPSKAERKDELESAPRAPPPPQQQQDEVEAEEDVREEAREPVQEEPEEQPSATQHAPAQERAAESEPKAAPALTPKSEPKPTQKKPEPEPAQKPEPDDPQEESEPDDSPRSASADAAAIAEASAEETRRLKAEVEKEIQLIKLKAEEEARALVEQAQAATLEKQEAIAAAKEMQLEAQRLMEAATMTKKNFINEMQHEKDTDEGERNHANRQIESDLQEARAMMDQARKMQREAQVQKLEVEEALAASRREGEKVAEEARRSAAIVEGQIKIRNYVYDPNVRPNGEPRNPAAVAMWAKAMSKLRMKLIFKRLGVGTVKVKPSESLGARLNKVESALDSLQYECKELAHKLKPDAIITQVDEIKQNLNRLKAHTASYATADDIEDSRHAIESIRSDLYTHMEHSMKGQRKALDAISREQRRPQQEADNAVQTSLLNMKRLADELAHISLEPQVKMMTIGPAIMSAHTVLNGLAHHPSGSSDPWPDPTEPLRWLEQAGWAIHFLLKKDDEVEYEAEQVQNGTKKLEGEEKHKLLIRMKELQCRSGYYELRDKAERTHKSVLEAMKTLVNPGKNLLDVRWHAHLHELTATQDQLQEQGAQLKAEIDDKCSTSELEGLPDKLLHENSWIEKLAIRTEAVNAFKESLAEKKAESEALSGMMGGKGGLRGLVRGGVMAKGQSASAGVQALMTDVQNLTDEVGGFSTTVQMLRNEIQEKADGKTLESRLSQLSAELRKNGSGGLSKADLESALKSKMDKKDVHSLAAALAGDPQAIDMDPGVLAKLQVSAFRCLSCNRPMRALGPASETTQVSMHEFPEQSVTLHGMPLHSEQTGTPSVSSNALPVRATKFSKSAGLPKRSTSEAWDSSESSKDVYVEDASAVSTYRRVMPRPLRNANASLDENSSAASSQTHVRGRPASRAQRPRTAGPL